MIKTLVALIIGTVMLIGDIIVISILVIAMLTLFYFSMILIGG